MENTPDFSKVITTAEEKKFWDDMVLALLRQGTGLTSALKGADDALEHRRNKFKP